MKAITLLALLAALCSCAPAEQVSRHEARIAELERKVAELETANSLLESQLAVNDANFHTEAWVDFSSQNFGVGHNQYGAYLIAPVNIEEAGAGYRVRFRVINLASTVLTDATISIRWMDGTNPHSQTETISGNFAPGTARSVSMTLAEATPTTLRRMIVDVQFAGARFAIP